MPEGSLFRYGMLENVDLTPDQHAKLIEKMGVQQAERYIDQLSTYLPNRTKKAYRNHYAVLLQWWLRDTPIDVKEVQSNARPQRESFQERSIREQTESSQRVRESLLGATGSGTRLEDPRTPGTVIPLRSRRP